MTSSGHGPEPTIIGASSPEKAKAELFGWIEACKAEGIDESEICVLARTNELVRTASEGLMAGGYVVNVLHRRAADDRSKLGLRACTMHRAKGLEFVAVAIVDVNAGVLPPRWMLDTAPDATVRRSIVEADKALLHVSATRAKKRLLVISTGIRSELLPDPLKTAA